MAITSRLLAIERLFGQRLDQIDESSLDRLVSTEQRETDQLDFKSKWTVSADADELRKDVCAFANSRGGLIIYGVRDEESKAVELTPFEATTDFRNQVAGILFSGCRPTPRFELTQLESSRSPGRYYVLLAVPQSSEAPHARLKDVKQEHMLNFPLRVETITRFMSESELAARYRARFQADAERSERTSELEQSFPIDGGSSQLSLAMRFCGVPSAAGEARIGSELINTWYERIRLLSDGTRSFGCPPHLDASQLRYRRRAIRIGSDDDYVEFYSDGSTVAHSVLVPPANVMGLDRYPGQPVCIQQRFVAVRIAALHSIAADFAVEGAGASGDLTTRISLVGARPEHGTPRPVLITSLRNGMQMPVSGAQPAFDACAESIAPLDILCGRSSAHTVESWRRSIDELSNCFGLSGSDLFLDAEIAFDQWDQDAATVRRWADDLEVLR